MDFLFVVLNLYRLHQYVIFLGQRQLYSDIPSLAIDKKKVNTDFIQDFCDFEFLSYWISLKNVTLMVNFSEKEKEIPLPS